MSAKRLFLIDGNSLLYRSYYAIQRLSTSQGFPTNAIYGFIITLRKIVDREKPEYLGVVFDVEGPTVRHKAYKDYKAHRKPMPEDLVIQMPVLKRIIGALRIPLFEYRKYEADDVLGSLASRAASSEVESVIVTTDKDILQLVDKTTSVFNPSKDMFIDVDNVKEYFGVPASQVVDVLALWGDPTDNVPGIPGIGEKTSKGLIRQFGSLDNLLKNIAMVKNPRIRQNIEENLELLELSRDLVTIERGLDVEFDLEKLAVREPDSEEIVKLYRELEFTGLLTEHLEKSEEEPRDYRALFEEAEVEKLAARIKKAGAVALDTETDSPFPTQARLAGMSIALEPGEAFYLPLGHDYPGAPAQVSKDRAFAILQDVLTDPRVTKHGQNIKYDTIVLRREGLNLRGIGLDSMVLSYLLEPNWGKHNLDKIAASYLHLHKIPYESVVGKGKNQITMNRAEVEKVVPYACQDADLALSLSRLLWDRVREKGLDRLYEDVERPLIELLAEMEMWGVKLDTGSLQELSAELASQISALEKKVYDLAGGEFNINSPQQLGGILFHKLNLPATRKTKITKGYSTSLDILQELAPLHPLAKYALEYRQLRKLKSTYADALPQLINPETGRIHTSYNQTVTATGRLSSSDPNLQNIPARGDLGKRFRRAFIPAEGHLFLAADYSQIELRILAHLSEDPALLETFHEDRDVHEETARRVFGELSGLYKDELRRRAKIINFSIIYGTSAFSLAKALETSTSEAQKFIDRYFEKHPRVGEYLERMVRDAKEKGYAETILGRQRQVPELRHADRMIQQAGRRIALNTPIQGSAADVMKVAMLAIWEEIRKKGFKSKMILQVHDELVFEVPEKEKPGLERIVRNGMENVLPLKVPLKAHLGWGPNWADAK